MFDVLLHEKDSALTAVRRKYAHESRSSVSELYI
jgi:hypothetical protein